MTDIYDTFGHGDRQIFGDKCSGTLDIKEGHMQSKYTTKRVYSWFSCFKPGCVMWSWKQKIYTTSIITWTQRENILKFPPKKIISQPVELQLLAIANPCFLKYTTKDCLLSCPHKDQPSEFQQVVLGFNLARHKGHSRICLPETNARSKWSQPMITL
jgi:hypothetical protein